MIVYEIKDNNGRIVAFQVPDVGKGRITKILKRVRKTLPLEFQKNSDAERRLLEFTVGNVAFEVVEMYDTDHRFWIGPIEFGVSPELDQLKAAFDKVSGGAFW